MSAARVVTSSTSGQALSFEGEGYQALVPARLLDTRPDATTVDGIAAGQGPLGPASTIDLQITGRAGIPLTGVGAVALNVTVTEPTSTSYITAWPTGRDQPLASNLNMVPGQTIPNLIIAKVGTNGHISLYNHTGTTHLIADIVGWFPTATGLNAVVPARLLDTRPDATTVDGIAAGQGPLGPASTIDLQITGRAGIPLTGVGAVALNVTVTEPTSTSYITAWPTGRDQPLASNLNMVPGQTIPNLIIAKVGTNGHISLYNHTGTTHLIADIVGWIATGSSTSSLLVPETTELYEAADLAAASAGTGGTVVIELERGVARPPVGGHLAVGPGPDLPSGFAGRVLAHSGNRGIVAKQAPLSSVFAGIDVTFDGAPAGVEGTATIAAAFDRSIPSAPREGAITMALPQSAWACEHDDVPTSAADLWSSNDEPIDLTVDETHVYHQFGAGLTTTPFMNFSFRGVATASITLTAKASFSCELSPAFRQSKRMTFEVGSVGPIPVSIVLEPTFRFEVHATGTVSISQRHHFGVTLGVTGLSALQASRGYSHDPAVLDFDAAIGGTLFAGGVLRLEIGGSVAGADFDAGIQGEFGPKLELTTVTESSRLCVQLDATLQASLTVSLQVWHEEWGTELANLTSSPIRLAGPYCPGIGIPETGGNESSPLVRHAVDVDAAASDGGGSLISIGAAQMNGDRLEAAAHDTGQITLLELDPTNGALIAKHSIDEIDLFGSQSTNNSWPAGPGFFLLTGPRLNLTTGRFDCELALVAINGEVRHRTTLRDADCHPREIRTQVDSSTVVVATDVRRSGEADPDGVRVHVLELDDLQPRFPMLHLHMNSAGRPEDTLADVDVHHDGSAVVLVRSTATGTLAADDAHTLVRIGTTGAAARSAALEGLGLNAANLCAAADDATIAVLNPWGPGTLQARSWRLFDETLAVVGGGDASTDFHPRLDLCESKGTGSLLSLENASFSNGTLYVTNTRTGALKGEVQLPGWSAGHNFNMIGSSANALVLARLTSAGQAGIVVVNWPTQLP